MQTLGGDSKHGLLIIIGTFFTFFIEAYRVLNFVPEELKMEMGAVSGHVFRIGTLTCKDKTSITHKSNLTKSKILTAEH